MPTLQYRLLGDVQRVTAGGAFAQLREFASDRQVLSRCAWILLVAIGVLWSGLRAAWATPVAEPVWNVLHKAQQASQRLNYQGLMWVQSGKHMQSSRVTHTWDPQHGELELIEPLQGQSVEWIRHNEDVQCVMHDSKTIRVDRRHATQAFSRLLSARIDELAERYTMQQKEADRVAGLDAILFELRPRDVHRFGYRLWLERDTHLLLRSQTLGENDEVLEQMSYSEIRIGQLPEKARPRMKTVGEGWKLEDATGGKTEAATLQLGFKPGVPGFRQVSGIVRWNRGSPVNQYVYTDGLASVSVFVEPYNPARPQANAVIQHGAVRTVVRRVGDYSVTAMGEVPIGTVKQFLHDIEIRKPQ